MRTAASRKLLQFGTNEFRDWLHEQKCYTCSSWAPVEQSHCPSRGAGGVWTDSFPQCSKCHREMHAAGVDTFSEKVRVDVRTLGRRCQSQWAKHRLQSCATEENVLQLHSTKDGPGVQQGENQVGKEEFPWIIQ